MVDMICTNNFVVDQYKQDTNYSCTEIDQEFQYTIPISIPFFMDHLGFGHDMIINI